MNHKEQAERKAALRLHCLARRVAADASAVAAASLALANRLLASELVPPRAAVAGYWPLAGELDPRPVLESLIVRGHPVCLPRTANDAPLTFHAWSKGDRLSEGRFKVMEPLPDAALLRPTVILVPLLAFDRCCRRLGHGKGYYDRTLAALRLEPAPPLAIGLALPWQEVDVVPVDAHDQILDMVVTAGGLFRRAATPPDVVCRLETA